jgi:hypothetical protein
MQLKMKVGLSGPELSLSPGDVHDFEDEAEAQRLIDAGIAEAIDPLDHDEDGHKGGSKPKSQRKPKA